MDGRDSRGRFAHVFNDVAAEYDVVRPSYPGELVDAAVRAGGLDSHSKVLEVGCGTGKLTELLVERQLRIDAVEPGANMVEAARRRLGPTAPVHFEVARFEDADLGEEVYDAVFSATAFHGLDPEVSWMKVASLLKPGGLLALLTHIGIRDEGSALLGERFVDVLRTHAPDMAEGWRPPRDLDAVVAGARGRGSNVSEVWDWVMGEGKHGLAVSEIAGLFGDVEVMTVLTTKEETADQVLAHFRTTSLYFKIAAHRREAFEDDDRRLVESLGGTMRSSRAAVLVTARRTAGARDPA